MKKETETFLVGALFGAAFVASLLIFLDATPKKTEENMRKQAILHNAAHYEVDTNGIVSFKWNK
jgi:hypothetical protein